MNFHKQKAEEVFDNFLMIMDDQIAHLKSEAQKDPIALDYSLRDLDNLEDLFDIMSKDLTKNELAGLIVLFGRYGLPRFH